MFRIFFQDRLKFIIHSLKIINCYLKIYKSEYAHLLATVYNCTTYVLLHDFSHHKINIQDFFNLIMNSIADNFQSHSKSFLYRIPFGTGMSGIDWIW